MQQDFLLIWKMKNGDEAAMDTFVRKYYPRILQYCLYHCPDREWAQDLTQETFEHFFRRLADYRHIGKELNYLYTIARNLCIDWSRQQKKQQSMTHLSGGRMKDSEIEGIIESDTSVIFPQSNEGRFHKMIASGFEETEKLDWKLMIEEALRKLPEELREVVILHYFQGLGLREVSTVLQIGLPLVKYRIKRAKELLREILE